MSYLEVRGVSKLYRQGTQEPGRNHRVFREVEHQIQLIASAATEQTAASGEISSPQAAFRSSRCRTRGAGEAVSALADLSRLASDLDRMIHQFQLDDGSGPLRILTISSGAPNLTQTSSAL